MKKHYKSYNPFTLWGSYIGAFFGAGYRLVSCPILECGTPLQWYGDISLAGFFYGFFIGWAIHAAFRKFLK